jgi:hypothetical protein
MHRGSTFICGAVLIAAQSCFALTVEELKLGLEEALTNSKSATASGRSLYVGTVKVRVGHELDLVSGYDSTQ